MNAGIAYTIPIASKSAPQPDTQVTLRSHTRHLVISPSLPQFQYTFDANTLSDNHSRIRNEARSN